jgi:hypothetical protein
MAVRERVQPFAMKFLLSVLTVGCPRQRSYNFWQVRRADQPVLAHIQELVDEEHRLLNRSARNRRGAGSTQIDAGTKTGAMLGPAPPTTRAARGWTRSELRPGAVCSGRRKYEQ